MHATSTKFYTGSDIVEIYKLIIHVPNYKAFLTSFL